MGPGWHRRQHLPGRRVFPQSGQVPALADGARQRRDSPPFRPAPAPLGSPLHGRPARAVGPRRKAHPSIGVSAPGSTAIGSTGIHLCALSRWPTCTAVTTRPPARPSPTPSALFGVTWPPAPQSASWPLGRPMASPWSTICTPATPPGRRGEEDLQVDAGRLFGCPALRGNRPVRRRLHRQPCRRSSRRRSPGGTPPAPGLVIARPSS